MFDIASLHRCSGRTIFLLLSKLPGVVELGKCHGVQDFFSPKHNKKTATQITPTATQFNFRVAETAMQNFGSKFIPVFEVRSRACSDRSITAYPAHMYSKYVLGLAVLHVMQALYASISRMVFRTSLRTVQDISTCFELWTFKQSAKITYSKRRDVLAVELCCRMFSSCLQVVRKVWVLERKISNRFSPFLPNWPVEYLPVLALCCIA